MSSRPPTPRAPWLPLVLAAVALAAPALVPARAAAQGRFRVVWTVERTGAKQVELTGQVSNDSPEDVVDVYVTAEALDASGRVLARGIAFVAGQIAARQASQFSARVPNVRGTTGFHVGVSSFRAGFGRNESP